MNMQGPTFARGTPRSGIGPHKETVRWPCKVRRSLMMKTRPCPRVLTRGKSLALRGSHPKGTSGTTLPNQKGDPLVKPPVAKGEGDPQPHHKKPRKRLCDSPHHPSPFPTPNPASLHMIGAPEEKTTLVYVSIVGSMGTLRGNVPGNPRGRG